MLRSLSILALCALPLAAEERYPVRFFPTPDSETARKIRALVQHLGGSTVAERRDARAEIGSYGVWAVPTLVDRLAGKRPEKAMRVRMNAVLALSDIMDPRSLEALRAAAKDLNPWVRRSAMLVLGHFRRPQDRDRLLAALRDDDPNAKHQVAAAVAVSKLLRAAPSDRSRPGDPLLREARIPLQSRDEHYVAGVLLAACVSTPDRPDARQALHRLLEERLTHKRPLVRRVAATGLIVRPGTPELLPRLLKRIHKEKDKSVRALLYGAVAALPRTDEVRDVLLRCACSDKEKDEVRAAAAIGLAEEPPQAHYWADEERYRRLRTAARKGRNDDVTGTLLFAWARTGRPEVVDELLKLIPGGKKYTRFYGMGCLGYLKAYHSGRDGAAEGRAYDIYEAVAGFEKVAKDPRVRRVVGAVKRLWGEAGRKDPAAVFRTLQSIDRYGLWSRTPRDRVLARLNARVYEVLELDYVPDIAGERPGASAPGGGAAPQKGGSTQSEEENDLTDFLRNRPYFEERDLGR
ncbi:MAG: HEAT repeat domain-containing protein [Planctomycetota bacterium]